VARLHEPVAVGWRPGNPNGAGCLVLAGDASPSEVGGYERVVDFAAVDVPLLRDAGRQRYQAFRQAGHAVAFHPAA
jgi:DNA polymerase IIIc chi subunit